MTTPELKTADLTGVDEKRGTAVVHQHAVTLLKDLAIKGGIVLDLGCGNAAVATEVRSLGLTYVGVDKTATEFAALREQGIEVHDIELHCTPNDLTALEAVIGSRPIAAIFALGLLEYLAVPSVILATLQKLALRSGAPIILSAPHIANFEVGAKLLFGKWNHPEDGLLQRNHLQYFTGPLLGQLAAAAGLHEVAENDVRRSMTERDRVVSQPALERGSFVHRLLTQMRGDRNGPDVTQLVRAYLPGPPRRSEPVADKSAPFLTVVTRTQGARIPALRDAAVCLAAQTDQDFEWLIVGHRLSPTQRDDVKQVIEDLPPSLRSRSRLIHVEDGRRAKPLKIGFEQANGRYVAMLDDDDTIFAHWIETFRVLAENAPGQIVRSVAVRQDHEATIVWGQAAPRATSGYGRIYSPEFDLFAHLEVNSTPNNTVAFPRLALKELGLDFDDELTTTEDWDLLMRAAFLLGVSSSPKITTIYRWWASADTSRVQHSHDEWRENESAVRRKLNASFIVLPPGSAEQLRQLKRNATPAPQPLPAPFVSERVRELVRTLDSRSWAMTKPLRVIGQLLGNPAPVCASDVLSLSDEEAVRLKHSIENSLSFRVAGIAKRLMGRR